MRSLTNTTVLETGQVDYAQITFAQSAGWRFRRRFDAASRAMAFFDSSNNRIDQSVFARRSVTQFGGDWFRRRRPSRYVTDRDSVARAPNFAPISRPPLLRCFYSGS
jgi:hypothetical protein